VKVREDRDGDIVVLEPQGRIDSTMAPLLGERLTAVLTGGGTRLVLDFQHLEYISSAGFRVLLLAAKHAETAGSRLVLCGIKGKVRQLFDLAGFLDLLPLYASREESLASLR
jgi:anti-sigma B factor antagonist